MSRVIKFRAFDPKNGMIEPYSVRNGKAWVMKPCRKDGPEVRVDGVNYYCNWDIDIPTDFPVMQFTGLLDANGVEVYEGDLIDWMGGIFCIKWEDSDASFFAVRIDEIIAESGQEWADSCVVIGNSYQNPELLK
jgi:hypothetical protein